MQILVPLVILVSALYGFRHQRKPWSWPESIAGAATVMLINGLSQFALSRDKDIPMTIVSWWTIAGLVTGIVLAIAHKIYLKKRNHQR